MPTADLRVPIPKHNDREAGAGPLHRNRLLAGYLSEAINHSVPERSNQLDDVVITH
jgi:hypothetical protein